MSKLGYSCDDKVRYAYEADAKAALKSAKSKRDIKKGKYQGRHNEKRREKRTYSCDVCGFWHTTSMTLEEYENRLVRK